MDAILESLNPRQRAAVCHQDSGLLVLAGAGTGKTRVLTARIAWLLAQQPYSPRDILAVTFTNKAAKEMSARIAAMVNFGFAGLTLGTFHGVCHRLLRRHAALAGLDKNFQILDSADQLTFIRRLLRDNQIDSEEFPPAECRYYINAAKESGVRADAAPLPNKRARMMRDIYALYEKTCHQENKTDFAELLLAAVELLRNHQDLRRHYANRFRHILIDEFQDTNPLQYQWLKLLNSGDNHFFAVGDDDQSIYSFRGADPNCMIKFQKEFRADTVVRLEENYRSTGNILQSANHLIAANTARLGKTLVAISQDKGVPLSITRAEQDLGEAADIILALRQKLHHKVSANDLAVMYRTNAQSRLLEKALIEYGIPYRIYGGTRFFERMEIKHALAYLRLAAADDDDSLLRVINLPPRGIGARTVAHLRTVAFADGWFAAVEKSDSPKVMAFAALLRKLRDLRAHAPLEELARAAVEQSGLLAYYEEKKEPERVENLREFVSAAAQFQMDNAAAEEDENDALGQFLANAALESGEAEGSAAEAVNLMTVHAAKGLEFSFVYVAGMEEGMFPHANSLNSESAAAVEEERRLMYVAITRARHELSLHFATRRQIYGEVKYHLHSRFLDELPKECLSAEAVAALTPPPRPTVSGAPHMRHSSPPPYYAVPPPPPSDVPGMLYRPGDVVRHPRYGQGVVISRQGTGDELQIQVTFKKVGIKIFKAALAPLEKIT